MTTRKRQIEIFGAGCPACEDAIKLVKELACPSCEVTSLDMKDQNVANRARELGVRSIPAILIDGKLADCCSLNGPDESVLRRAGIGQPL